jgi:hypothetical protein
MGRITVDAREKEGHHYDALLPTSVATARAPSQDFDMSSFCVGGRF